jgi:hypothetical protein
MIIMMMTTGVHGAPSPTAVRRSVSQDQDALFAAAFNSVQKIVPPCQLSIRHFSLYGGQIVPNSSWGVHTPTSFIIIIIIKAG